MLPPTAKITLVIHDWGSRVPKLMFTAEPGRISNPELIAWCKASLPNLEVVPIGAGLHYVQEDNPDAIGAALARWVPTLTPS